MPQRKISEGNYHFQFDDPNECPYCSHMVVPEFLRARMRARGAAEPLLQVAYGCPDPACGGMFVATYGFRQKIGMSQYSQYKLQRIAPTNPRPPQVPEEVASVSPTYKEILTQAATAEAFGLNQVAGMGYRKGLEFLVKDFVISRSPKDEEAVKAELLGNVIANRISDENIQACARRAAWLGNDETHYVRQWTDKDIGDLRTLLKLTETWILNSLQMANYLKDMPGKPQ